MQESLVILALIVLLASPCRASIDDMSKCPAKAALAMQLIREERYHDAEAKLWSMLQDSDQDCDPYLLGVAIDACTAEGRSQDDRSNCIAGALSAVSGSGIDDAALRPLLILAAEDARLHGSLAKSEEFASRALAVARAETDPQRRLWLAEAPMSVLAEVHQDGGRFKEAIGLYSEWIEMLKAAGYAGTMRTLAATERLATALREIGSHDQILGAYEVELVDTKDRCGTDSAAADRVRTSLMASVHAAGLNEANVAPLLRKVDDSERAGNGVSATSDPECGPFH